MRTQTPKHSNTHALKHSLAPLIGGLIRLKFFETFFATFYLKIVLLRPMRKTTGWLLFSLALFLAPACKSSYEKIRTSGDAELILTKAFEFYEKKQYQRALTLFDLVLNTLRGDARAEKAYYEYAYCHYNTKQYLLAAYYFKTFSNTFPNSPFREEAAFMSAYSNYQLSPIYRLDQGNTLTAIEEFQLFVNVDWNPHFQCFILCQF